MWMKISAISFVALMCFLSVSAKMLKETNDENCEVCVKFLRKFIDGLDPALKSNPDKIQVELKKVCNKARKADNRFCYYVGGTDDSATSILGDITKPISWSMPAENICLKVYKKDHQICDLKYEKQLDLANVNNSKLKVKDLKKILSDWEEQCKGCTEKTDFVRRIEELMPIYAPEAAAAKKNEL